MYIYIYIHVFEDFLFSLNQPTLFPSVRSRGLLVFSGFLRVLISRFSPFIRSLWIGHIELSSSKISIFVRERPQTNLACMGCWQCATKA